MKSEIMDLIDMNRNLIYKIASYYSNYYDVEDLFQVGVLGLIDAKKHYNDSLSTKFTSFAYIYIKGEIIKYIKNDRNIKLSTYTMKLYKLYEKTKDYLLQKLQREPSLTEICSYLEIDECTMSDAISQAAFTLSLDFELETNEEYYNFVQVNNEEEVDNSISIKDEIDKLSEFDRKIVDFRYYKDYSQSETADELGVSQVKICRSEKHILKKMYNNMVS
ncbi:MAG: sigma-70 family RNA polymerase sigma factor [Bacilli bacterium]